MDLYWNLTTGALNLSLESSASSHIATDIVVGGGQDEPVRVQTHRTGVPTLPPADSDFFLGVKPATKYADGAHLTTIESADWTAPGDADGFFEGTLVTDTTEIRAALLVDGNANNDVQAITSTNVQLYYWPPGADRPVRSQIFSFRITNWVTKGGEAIPEDADPPYPDPSTLVSRSFLMGVIGISQSGSVEIPFGQSYCDVTFDAPFDDDTWFFTGLIVKRTGGVPSNLFPGVVTAKSNAGFRVQLNGDVDAAAFYVEYVASTRAPSGLAYFGEAPVDSATYGRKNAEWMLLGTAALTPATDYATAAQGAVADSALQPAGDGSSLTNLNAGAISSGIVPQVNGGAGGASGLLKADGSGTVTAATANVEYLEGGAGALAALYTVSGITPFSGTVANPTSITFDRGICTACS